MKELLRPHRAISPARAAASAILAPAVATLVALPMRHLGPDSAGSILLLGVVAAAAIGGLWSGLGASLLAFISLNFFFTPPLHTLRVEGSDDVIALLVFLAVAAVVGSLLARAIGDRERAARREDEARLLNYLTTRLLSGEPLDTALDDFAAALLEPFGLARCEIRATVAGESFEAIAERFEADLTGPSEVMPIVVGNVSYGTLTAIRLGGEAALGGHELDRLRAHARQLAVAIERAELDAQIRGARRESETSELRAALFSSVTHDLRTPLVSIKAAVTSLLQVEAEYGPEQERELLETILEETDRLNRLVGKILDLARIRAGALVPRSEPIPIDEVIEAVLHRLRRDLEPFRVRVLLRPDLPDVRVDPVQIDQVLTNVLENAVRFSPKGGEILISAAEVETGMVRVRIADEGPGIPREQREAVFEPFHRGDDRGSLPGTGLGLAIARAIVVAHEGRIWIEETPPGGTALVVDLPIARLDAAPRPGVSRGSPAPEVEAT